MGQAVKHGIQIWVVNEWLFVEAVDREHADNLQNLSVTKVPYVHARRVVVTEFGDIVTINATE